jgi:hypothetical protein
MINHIKDDPNWRHLSYEEYLEQICLYDTCPCGKMHLGLFVKNGGEEFVVLCYECHSFVLASKRINALTMWNRKCRLKKGSIK